MSDPFRNNENARQITRAGQEQLGHRDTTLTQTAYGEFVPDERDDVGRQCWCNMVALTLSAQMQQLRRLPASELALRNILRSSGQYRGAIACPPTRPTCAFPLRRG